MVKKNNLTIIKNLIKYSLAKFGFQIIKKSNDNKYPIEFSNRDLEILEYVKNRNLTMISEERMFENIQIAKWISQNELKGDFIECGVWRGGSTLLVKMIFEEYGNDSNVWLFDTFEGMTEPKDIDQGFNGINPINQYNKQKNNSYVDWCYASYEDVQNNFKASGVNLDECIFIKGGILNTLPEYINKIEKVSFLRLDTDWYESTKLELELLYPKIVKDGFLVIDDYGYWKGSKKAVDEYFQKNNIHNYMGIIDSSSRVVRK